MKGERLDLIPAALQARVNAAITTARAIVRNGKELEIVAIIGDADTGDAITVEMSDGTENARETGPRMVRKTAELMGATFILVVSEAWHAKMPKETRERYKQVRDVPGRRDVVVFQLETHHGMWHGTSDIPPHKGRAPRYFEDPEFRYAEKGEGRLIGLLPVPAAPKH